MRSALIALLPVAFLLLIVCFWADVQIRIFTPACGEADCDGYVLLAKRIASLGPIAIADPDLFIHQNHVWVENARGELLPKYAPGYPLLMAGFYLVGGDEAMSLVSPVFGGLALIGAFLLFRRWSNSAVALVATAVFAANPLYLFYSGYLLAHAAEVCFTIWGMYFLWRWLDPPTAGIAPNPASPSPPRSGFTAFWISLERLPHRLAIANRNHALDGLLAGLALGFAVTIRHTAAALALAIVVALITRLIADLRQRCFSFKPLAILCSSYAFFPALLMAYNWRYFDSPFRTGYALTGEQAAFSREQLLAHAQLLLTSLNGEMMLVIFSLGLIGILAVGTLAERWIKLVWFVPAFVIYSSYYWAPGGMGYCRFLFPALPLFIGAAFALIYRLNASGFSRGMAIIALATVTIVAQSDNFQRLLGFDPFASLQRISAKPLASPRAAAQAVARAARVARQTLSDDAVLFAADAVQYDLGTRRHFRLYSLAAFRHDFGGQFRPNPRSAEPLMQPQRRQRLDEFYRANTDAQLKTKQEQLIRQFMDAKRQVVFIIPRDQLPALQKRFATSWDFKPLKEWIEPQWAARKDPSTWGIYQLLPKVPSTQP